ncbi:MAG: hypothetical protein ACRBFS_25310 [Aureispira sp.]
MNGNFVKRSNSGWLLPLFVILFFCQCNGGLQEELKKREATIHEYQQREEEEDLIKASYIKDLDNINNRLDTARVLQSIFQKKEGLSSRKEALEKIEITLQLLDSIEVETDTMYIASAEDFFVKRSFDAAHTELIQLRTFYREVKHLLNEAELENLNIKQLLEEANREIERKGVVIGQQNRRIVGLERNVSTISTSNKQLKSGQQQLEADKEALRIELKGIARQLENTRSKLTSEKQALAEVYYERAEDLIEQFNRALIKGDKAKRAIKEAYQALQKSSALNYSKADNRWKQIKRLKKYNKYL